MSLLTRKKLVAIGATALLILTTAACSSGTSPSPAATTGSGTSSDPALAKLITAAKAEGTVTWYTGVPEPAVTPVVAAFTKKYGIKVVVNRNISSVLSTLVTAEQQSGKVVGDVVTMSDVTSMKSFADNGWLLTANKKKTPAVADWPAADVYTSTGSTLLQSVGVYTLAYNTQLATGKNVPKQWSALINPKWKGKIILNDPRASLGSLGWFYDLYLKYGASYLKKLGAQDPQYSNSTVTGINSVASGDVAMIGPSAHWNNTDLISQGAPIADAYPSPSMGGAEEWAGISKGAPHPNAAALLFDFLFSKEGQTATCKSLCSSPVHAAGTLPLPADYQSPNLTAAAANKAKILGYLGIK
jgi:iron(III) transport system substrate-binding protein